ncbi:hypothetical protein B12161_15950 [Campylobacter jejuni]|nr:hypothetical protein B12161_15950 [Campylobacter jejuni]
MDWEPSIENLRKIRPAMVEKNEFSAEKGCKQSQEEFDRISQWDLFYVVAVLQSVIN